MKIHDEIMSSLGVEFVRICKAMAGKPGSLEANWIKVKAVVAEPAKA